MFVPNEFELRPPGPKPITLNPINALSGVAYGTGSLISPLLIVRNLYVAWQFGTESLRCRSGESSTRL
jgi:hypothetical protein